MSGYQIAECPSCSLQIRVVYDLKYIQENFNMYM